MEEQEQKIIEISPLSKGKRFLLFLGDFFIAFIIAFSLFNLATFPLTKLIFKTDDMYLKYQNNEKEANQLLIDNGFLFKEPNASVSTFEESVNYTFKVFLSYYLYDEEVPDANNPQSQYGHKLENEVIYKYFTTELDEAKYIEAFKQENEKHQMFEIGDNFASISLKADYKAPLKMEFEEQQNESKYTNTMKNMRDHVFARLFYLHVYQNIQEKDFVRGSVSYLSLMNDAKNISIELQWIAVVSSLITTGLAWGVVYLLVPLLNKDKRTLTMMVMKLDKVHVTNLAPADNWVTVIQSFYYLIFSLSFAIFLPSVYLGISYVFNLPLLFVFTFVGLLFMIASGAFIIFNEYNRSGVDILSSAVIVPTSEIENMYQERLEDGRLPSQGTDER